MTYEWTRFRWSTNCVCRRRVFKHGWGTVSRTSGCSAGICRDWIHDQRLRSYSRASFRRPSFKQSSLPQSKILIHAFVWIQEVQVAARHHHQQPAQQHCHPSAPAPPPGRNVGRCGTKVKGTIITQGMELHFVLFISLHTTVFLKQFSVN